MNKIIISKYSKLEWEMKKFNMTNGEIEKKYISERANYKAIINSHNKQLEVRDTFINTFNNSLFIMADDIDKYNLNTFDLIIVLGGDNIFCKISHHVNNIPILGVNSDPERSVGCLTRWAIHKQQDIIDLAEIINTKEFSIDEWTRLKATIDGKEITQASNEYYFGEKTANKMSRHVMVYNGQEQEQKCSGIIVSTGSGSTGWYRSIHGSRSPFNPVYKMGAFVVREPYAPIDNGCYSGEIGPKEELILYSLNDDEGLVSIDAWEEEPFIRGSKAVISVGRPLKIIIPNRKQDV